MVLLGAKDDSSELSLLRGHEATLVRRILEFVPNYQAKVVLVGTHFTGKSALIERLFTSKFRSKYAPSFFEQTLTVVNLQTTFGSIQIEMMDVNNRSVRRTNTK